MSDWTSTARWICLIVIMVASIFSAVALGKINATLSNIAAHPPGEAK